ncbi:hypothetical protein ACIHFE_12315 [Streptomyces sp. NPDC052396]|uniref:hypothetical protein n=1 Tax=Streptomyces sp. NPDC052396 TaxID=3365689 RepID=UPI0037D116D3
MGETAFASEHKSDAAYLDVAANAHGEEKALLVHRALRRVQTPHPQVVEIGPGGGAAVLSLADRLAADPRRRGQVNLTVIEAPGVASASLVKAMNQFNQVGTCDLVSGFAQDLDTILEEPVDVISASALLHEVYSYGGGYGGVHSMARTLPGVLRPGGFFAYRDVYAVNAPSLHQRSVHLYDAKPWLQFLRMFVPQYLREGTHPYHGAHDEMLFRQHSRIVPVERLDDGAPAFVSAPVGLFREVQRHYITFRDHVWRSGALGFRPILDDRLPPDWLDARAGHKRVHYILTGRDGLPAAQGALLPMLSESCTDHYTVDGDLFDEVTDTALSVFLDQAEQGEAECGGIWDRWVVREGRETYAYLTVGELLTTFAVSSVAARRADQTILVPVRVSDVTERDRSYYNRYLRRTLSNPLRDAKQLVLFSNAPLADHQAVGSALATLQRWCSRTDLAHIHSALNTGGRHAQ